MQIASLVRQRLNVCVHGSVAEGQLTDLVRTKVDVPRVEYDIVVGVGDTLSKQSRSGQACK